MNIHNNSLSAWVDRRTACRPEGGNQTDIFNMSPLLPSPGGTDEGPVDQKVAIKPNSISAAASTAALQPFDPCDSFEIRMGGLPGMARWEYIEKTYVKPRKTNLLIWDNHGKVRVQRSKLNMRAQRSIAMRYARIFLNKWLMSAFRGNILHIPSTDAVDEDGHALDEFLGGATRIEGIIYAAEMEPENENVVWVKARGIPGTLEFDVRTPPDVQVWSLQESNSYHMRSEMTVIEIYDQAEPAQA